LLQTHFTISVEFLFLFLFVFFSVATTAINRSSDQAIKRAKAAPAMSKSLPQRRYGGMGHGAGGGGEPIDGQRWLLLAFRNDKTVKK